MIQKKTLVIGASTNPRRYSHKAIRKLRNHSHPVEAISLREGMVEDVLFKTGFPKLIDIHTVTLYIGTKHQPQYYEYLVALAPVRVIFNPGTENDELIKLLSNNNIEAVENCTLVMLGSGFY